jgi:hypothetical protein
MIPTFLGWQNGLFAEIRAAGMTLPHFESVSVEGRFVTVEGRMPIRHALGLDALIERLQRNCMLHSCSRNFDMGFHALHWTLRMYCQYSLERGVLLLERVSTPHQRRHFPADYPRTATTLFWDEACPSTLSRPPACMGCGDYLGQTNNGVKLICGIHPYGWAEGECPDKREKTARGAINVKL